MTLSTISAPAPATTTAANNVSTGANPSAIEVSSAGSNGAAPPSNIMAVSNGPGYQDQVISLAIDGVDPKTAPTITIVMGPAGGELGIKSVDFIFEGTKQAQFNADGSVSGYLDGRKAIYTLEDTTLLDGMHAKDTAAVTGALEKFSRAAELLVVCGENQSKYVAAQKLIEEGVILLGNRATLTAQPNAQITDPRLVGAEAIIKQRDDLELVDTRSLQSPPTLLTNLALGIESLVVKSKSTGVNGNVHQTVIETSPFGVDVKQQTFDGPDRLPQQKLAARLENNGFFNAGNVDSVVSEGLALGEALTGNENSNPPRTSLLPRATPSQRSDNILGSDQGFELMRLGALSSSENAVVAGYGHIHEKGDSRGTLLKNHTVPDGVFQFEGKLLPGSKITVKAGSTLMIDLQPGSEVELIVEPGAKVMCGPADLGLNGCKVSGRIQGDLTGIDLKGITWGNNEEGKRMGWQDFKEMIYDTRRCDQPSIDLFIKKSVVYKDTAGRLQVDRKNLSFYKLQQTLAEKFPTTEIGPRSFMVEGSEPHRGIFVRLPQQGENGYGKVMVLSVIVAPGQLASKITESELKELEGRQYFDSEHLALQEILRQRSGGYGGEKEKDGLRVENIPTGIVQVKT